MKRVLILFLSILLGVSLLSAGAYAYSEGYFYYEIEDGGIVITGYFGKEETVTVPAMIAGYPVFKIAPGAFDGTSVKTLILPDTIMEVGAGAIPGGVNLSSSENDKPSQPSKPPELTTGEQPSQSESSNGANIPVQALPAEFPAANNTQSSPQPGNQNVGTQPIPQQAVPSFSSGTTVTEMPVPEVKADTVIITETSTDGRVDEIEVEDMETSKATPFSVSSSVPDPTLANSKEEKDYSVLFIITVGLCVLAAILLICRRTKLSEVKKSVKTKSEETGSVMEESGETEEK